MSRLTFNDAFDAWLDGQLFFVGELDLEDFPYHLYYWGA